MELPAFAIVFSVLLALFGLFANFLIFILVLLPSSSNQVSKHRNDIIDWIQKKPSPPEFIKTIKICTQKSN